MVRDPMLYPQSLARANAPSLHLLTEAPLNAELTYQQQVGVITPNHAFYVRNHFPVPTLDLATWQLTIAGAVAQPTVLTLADWQMLPRRSLVVTMECGGNGRIGMHPTAQGEPWGYGAVSTAEWSGVPLHAILAATGIAPEAVEILVTGADAGVVPEVGQHIAYARSLSVAQALHPDTLLADTMNGEPLPPNHGFPVRLIVPGWYGMAAVKWVTRIEALRTPFAGFYQRDRYVLVYPEQGDAPPIPLTTMGVRALITTPAEGATLATGTIPMCGVAWSGAAPIDAVQVSVDDGATWQEATWTSAASQYAWRTWEFRWQAMHAGPVRLRSRAIDTAGTQQPEAITWNTLGYANHSIQAVSVMVGDH